MRKGSAISTALFLLIILLVFSAVSILTDRVKRETPRSQPGYVDLSEFDFDEALAYISHTSFLYYKNEFYTAEDFLLGRATKEPIALSALGRRFDPGNYGTYRIVLTLPEGRVYGLSAYSAMYAQRLFINGIQYTSVGTPGRVADTTVPKTNHYTVYFKPETAQTEIIIQFSNFYHADFGGVMPVYIGAQDLIMARDAAAQQRVHLLAGCIFTAFLFFLGMFFFFRKRYAFLWFSLACFMMGLRMLLVEEKVLMLLIPDLPWTLAIGLEYMTLIALVYSFLLYIHSMFPGALHKAVLWVFGALCALFAVVVLLTPTVFYTGFILWFQVVAAVCGIYVVLALIYNAVRKKENRHREHLLIFTGTFVFIVLSILDIQIHREGGRSLAIGLTETGMMIFVFLNMIALAFQFSRTEAALDEARQSEREMQETNRLLDKMSRLKTDFLANISHEMRTPLTVMSSYAGLTSMQIRHNAVDMKTLENLDIIKREAMRLASMVEHIKAVSLEKERQLTLTNTDAKSLLEEVAGFCAPICLKNNNRILVHAKPKNIRLHVNADGIFQALVNLITNANRHTQADVIRLSAQLVMNEAHLDRVVISVTDKGDGIDPALLPKLFRRGVSGDNSTGIGLAICKEIIEEHGGEICITSELGKGTMVSFTLPLRIAEEGEK